MQILSARKSANC